MSDEINTHEIDDLLEQILTVPDDQLLALHEFIEKLGGVEQAQEAIEALQELRDIPRAA